MDVHTVNPMWAKQQRWSQQPIKDWPKNLACHLKSRDPNSSIPLSSQMSTADRNKMLCPLLDRFTSSNFGRQSAQETSTIHCCSWKTRAEVQPGNLRKGTSNVKTKWEAKIVEKMKRWFKMAKLLGWKSKYEQRMIKIAEELSLHWSQRVAGRLTPVIDGSLFATFTTPSGKTLRLKIKEASDLDVSRLHYTTPQCIKL